MIAAATVALLGLSLIVASGSGTEEKEEENAIEDVDEDKVSNIEKSKEVEEEEEDKPNTAPSEPEPATPDPAPEKTSLSPEETAAAEAASAREGLKQEFSDVTRKGTKFMKASAFERAAAQFGRAIEIAETLDMPQSSLETLYNNRAAMYEKAGMLDSSLQDCTVVLAMNASHVKVRKRRARIYQEQGRIQDALVEYCAVLVADTVDMKKKLEPFKDHPEVLARQQQVLMNDKGEEQALVQERLQELMTLCGKAMADKVLKDRENNEALINTGITSESSVFQLLLSYTEYLDLEPTFRTAELSTLTEAVKSANSGEDLSAKTKALRDRAMYYLVQRKYQSASDDLMAAYSVLKTQYPHLEAEGDDSNMDKPDDCALLRWIALFHHVKYDLDTAFKIYGQATKLALNNNSALSLIEVMKSGVLVDKGDVEAAEAAMEKAAQLNPDSVDVLMHRSQLCLLKQDPEKSEVDLRKCLVKRPNHIVAQLRLAMMLIGQVQQLAAAGDQAGAEAKLLEADQFVNRAKTARPNMSEVYQVAGTICELRGDVTAAMATHDKAIAIDPKNPTPYINKAMLISQTAQPTTQEEAAASGTTIMELYKKAIEVDPLCSQAQKLLAEMKLRFATEFEETEGIISGLAKAISQCRDPTELVELCTFSCIASAQLEGAKDLGMSSFADING